MPPLDLRAFTVRARALVDASPPTSMRDTRRWLVEPFLETLGWDVRADSCVTDRDVDDLRLEYVPTVDSIPALFVAVEPAADSLEEARANALRRAMAWTGVDRAIYTNGREYLLLAGTTDVDYRAVGLADLPDEESALANYSRTTLGSRLERHSRELVARQLAIERPVLVASIVDRLTAATTQGAAYTDEFEAATERLLDRLVVAFAEDEPAPSDPEAVSVRFTESAITDEPSAGTPEHDRPAGPDTSSTRPQAETTSGSDADDPTAGPRDDEFGAEAESESGDEDESGPPEDGEYVVRFFNDRGSVGAIGHSTSEGALVEAAEYLFDRGLSGVEVPWHPNEGEGTVLNAEPIHADGSPMSSSTQLSNGLYLATSGDADVRAARVEALAERAGLRAMLTGDWGR